VAETKGSAQLVVVTDAGGGTLKAFERVGDRLP